MQQLLPKVLALAGMVLASSAVAFVDVAVASSPLNEHLEPLEWLLGEWAGTTDDAAIVVSSHACDGGNYILREYAVVSEGREVISGTQRIGWDPVGRQIKSWSFDSQGGSGEAIWRLDGKRWIVDSHDVTSEGKKSKTSATFTPSKDGQFVWEAKCEWDAKTPGQELPVLRVEFKRAPEAE